MIESSFQALEARLYLSSTDLDSDVHTGFTGAGLCACSVCTGMASLDLSLEQGETASASSTAAPAPSYTASGVPIYHSLPAATATLYLDFDGHFESTWGSYRNVTTPAYDIDGNAGSFSATELGRIHEIWARVAEDYAPFNINVTTEEPASFANGLGMRIVIGGSSYDWYGYAAGGVAYINSFTNSVVNTAYVFPAQLGNGNAKYVAEAVSHESGHAFGLSHQSVWSNGSKTQEYNPGGNGWAPIMGNSYSQALSTWHNGQNSSGAYQDDLSILSRTQNGFGYRVDDHGDSSLTASALALQGSSVSASGVIAQGTDLDTFYFDADTGEISLSVGVAQFGPNLDVMLWLYDSFGSLVASASPTTLSASITTVVDAGRYFLHVGSTGLYGRLGQFFVSGTIVPGSSPQVPDVGVTLAGQEISDGQTTAISFGTVDQNVARPTRTFTVTNSGNGVLELGPVQLPSGFILTEGLAASLGPGESDTFTVELDTSAAGSFSGSISFATNDPDESVFNFSVSGSVLQAASGIEVAFAGKLSATYYDADGDAVTISLKGRGTGVVFLDGTGNRDAVSITVDGSNAKTVLTITTGSGRTTVRDITVNGPLGKLDAPTTDLTGNLTIDGACKQIVLGDVSAAHDQALTIGSGPTKVKKGTNVRLGRVSDAIFSSGTALRSLAVQSWTDTGGQTDEVTAPVIGKIQHVQNFDPSLSQTQPSPRRSAQIKAQDLNSDRFDAILSAKALWELAGRRFW